MKLRIQDSSIRFRITLKELEILERDEGLMKVCHIPSGGSFRYGARVDRTRSASEIALGPFQIELIVSAADFAHLAEPTREGIYIHREWTAEDGESRRFIAFIEKDRPGSVCVKPEEWIYDGHHGGPNVVTPISAPSTNSALDRPRD